MKKTLVLGILLFVIGLAVNWATFFWEIAHVFVCRKWDACPTSPTLG
jgi:hypothetical protein